MRGLGYDAWVGGALWESLGYELSLYRLEVEAQEADTRPLQELFLEFIIRRINPIHSPFACYVFNSGISPALPAADPGQE